MATLTFSGCMRSYQRKPIHVPVNIPSDLIPAAYGMALLAVAAHLAPMNVCMAIGALFSHMGKNQIDMTAPAGEPRVHPLKGELCLAVIEIRGRPDRGPARHCMAVLALDFHASMRTGGAILSMKRWKQQMHSCACESESQQDE